MKENFGPRTAKKETWRYATWFTCSNGQYGLCLCGVHFDGPLQLTRR